MPKTQLRFYQDADGTAPVRQWLAELHRRDPIAHAKCVARIERLAELGHELRRPEADFLRDGIYELRARKGHVNYRILYFFHGRHVAVLAHALTKEAAVPATDIARAVRRKAQLEADPKTHVHEE
ncbi:MAG: type II toxin-antitoxin system RelE/ParE family toxin [Planctomycetes bacterium]|nr:type II toxin-antitoxin system RelE/ParE family toxin [Planctomycetota bacterium]